MQGRVFEVVISDLQQLDLPPNPASVAAAAAAARREGPTLAEMEIGAAESQQPLAVPKVREVGFHEECMSCVLTAAHGVKG